MTLEPVQLYGITKDYIQQIFEDVIKQHKQLPKIVYLDASYLYTFHLDDFVEVRKLNLLTRYDHSLAIEWHRLLERWCQDQTVNINGREIKPIKISRAFDRIVNEGMEMIAASIIGIGTVTAFNFRTIGDGDIDFASPSDTDLVNRVDIIDVNTTPEGGSLSRDGATVYSIGNHAKTVPTPANDVFTECGMHNTDQETTDRMLDHSVFADPIPHVQNADAPGSTTVIYQCSI